MKKRAFTLAEVLVTITVIGFLCMLTLPTLMQTRGTTEYVKKARKNLEILQVAINEVSAMNNNYTPDDWETVRKNTNKAESIVQALSKRLPILSYCGDKPNGCFATDGYRTISGSKTNILFQDMKPNKETMEKESYKFESRYTLNDEFNYGDSDYNSQNINVSKESLEYTTASPKYSNTYISLIEGGSVAIKTNSTYCNGKLSTFDGLNRPLCGIVYIDVNGQSKPNILGVDLFGFYLSGNTLLPMGFYGDEFKFSDNCRRDLKNNEANGLGCSAWALINKNMDYRKCVAGKFIDWTSKTTCDAK